MNTEFSEFFKAPVNYSEPQNVTELDGSTQFPNLNSIEFRNRQNDNGSTLLPFYEILEANEDQSTILLATNSYNQRIWNGQVWGYDKFTDVGKSNDKSLLHLPFDSNVTGIGWTGKSMVVFTTASGSIQLWSTQSEIRRRNGYSLFQVAKKTEHFGLISGFTINGNEKDKAVTGSTDGCLKVWKLAACDITSEKTFRYAHKEAITDISSQPQSSNLFATSSRDRSLSIWDLRSKMPLVNTRTNEHFAYSACLWVENNLFLGDDSGQMHILDCRKLNEYLVTISLFERPIYKFKLSPSKKLLCVLGQTNTLKVVSTETSDAGTVVYNDSSASDYVRDICWMNDKNEAQQSFCSIGWSNNIGQHSVNV